MTSTIYGLVECGWAWCRSYAYRVWAAPTYQQIYKFINVLNTATPYNI